MKTRLLCLLSASTLAWAALPQAEITPPAEFRQPSPQQRSPLLFRDGREVKTPQDWTQRRQEILHEWHQLMGEWPPLLEKPSLDVLATTQRETITQQKIRVQVAPAQSLDGYLLLPAGSGPFPAVFVPYYDPETSIGLTEKPLRDFAWQLARRGFVALAVGSPGGDARLPVLTVGAQCQPLSYLGYVAANAWQALAHLPQVDRQRIGIVGHSYGGKWALFGSCLFEKYACAAWSDPGIVFDETRGSINYQEPWYLGHDPQQTRKPGLVRLDSPRTGAYKTLIEQGHDLHELHVLMAPRPFLVSGGAEDPPKRWTDLHWALKVNQLLGHADRVAMTNRDKHDPNEASNARIYAFFEHWLKR
jgi:dienelactone hydrolase